MLYADVVQLALHVHRDQVLVGQIVEHDAVNPTLLELVLVLRQADVVEPFLREHEDLLAVHIEQSKTVLTHLSPSGSR